MTQTGDDAIAGSSNRGPRHRPWYLQTRNVIGMVIAVVMISVGAFGVAKARKPDLVVDCAQLRVDEFAKSQEFLIADLETQVDRLEDEKDLAADRKREADAAATAARSDAEAAQATADAAEAAKPAVQAAVEKADADATAARAAASAPDATEADEAEAAAAEEAAKEALAAATDAAAAVIASSTAADNKATEAAAATAAAAAATAELEAVEAQLDQKIAALEYAQTAEPGDPAAAARKFSAPRSTVSFDSDVAVAKIHFGSTRNAKRVEIRLTPQTEVAEGGATNEQAAEQAATAPLPDTYWFVSDTDQLRRNSGLEIPADQVTTWARRFGDQVFLSVCIDPTSAVDAGKYEGSIHIVDPTMRQVSVPIEVTAQSVLINWILWTLLIAPVLAFLFVWIKLRHAANEDSSLLVNVADKGVSLAPPFKKWIQSNFILAYVVGVGAVWAALQVPLNNVTFGDSLIKAAAAVVVTLVAAVGAITPVVGKVRGDELGKSEHSQPIAATGDDHPAGDSEPG
jgi:chemotaxis protein histidine kinase CheA